MGAKNQFSTVAQIPAAEEFIYKEFDGILFAYNPDTGQLFRRLISGKWKETGKTHHSKGTKENKYRIHINRGKYFTHRFIWFLIYDEWPDTIDHINHKPTDNRLANLRSVSNTMNNRNRKIHKDGHLHGTTYMEGKSIRPWCSQFYLPHVGRIYINYHATAEEAHEAYKLNYKEWFGEEFVHGMPIRTTEANQD